ncbi:MAG: ComEC/Rec2 family competence protein [bacterium]|nr:ComEC/Rec2 family competence protein [bacterium]
MPLHDKAFYLALFFIIGAGAVGFEIGIYLALIGAFLLARFFFSLKTKTSLLLTLVCFLGVFYGHLYQVLNKAVFPLEEQATLQGLVVAEPEEGINYTELEVELEKPHRGRVLVYTSLEGRYRYGDKIAFTGEVELASWGRYIASFPKIEIIERDQGSSIKSYLIGFKGKLVDKLRAVLPPKHAALASGILLGERAEFTKEFEEAMRLSGTTHIVALSGYNIAILALVLSATFSYLWNRKVAFYLSLAVIPGFVVMTGAEPSVVRAGIMGLILLLAEHQNRPYSFRNAITLTALVMVFINPLVIKEDVGFQLSFAALLGIVYIYPLLREKLKVYEEGFLAWKKNALQTASAQIAVLPIIITAFGFFSPSALVSNVLILEFIPIAMLLSFTVAVLGFISYPVSLTVGWIASIFLGYEIFIIELFGFNWF